MQRILPIWRCKSKCRVYTSDDKPKDGRCGECEEKLYRTIPLRRGEPHCFHCSACKTTFATKPVHRKGIRWHCPSCGEPKVSAYGITSKFLQELMQKEASEEERQSLDVLALVSKDNPFDFTKTIKNLLGAQVAVNAGAFEANRLGEILSKRRTIEKGDTFIDQAVPDIKRFNVRAQMVMDMLLVKNLLEAAGLSDFVKPALERILDARLLPSVSGHSLSKSPRDKV